MNSFKSFRLLLEMSNTKLEMMYNNINRIAFDNELPPIKPKVSSRLTRATGLASAKVRNGVLIGSPEIKISDKYVMDDDEVEVILAHEMIHVWFFMQGDFKESHGVKFKAKAREVGQKLRKEIPLTHDAANLEIARGPKDVYVILYIENPSKMYITFYNAKSFIKNHLYAIAAIQTIKPRSSKLKDAEIRYMRAKTMLAHKYPVHMVSKTRSPNIYSISPSEAREFLNIRDYRVIE